MSSLDLKYSANFVDGKIKEKILNKIFKIIGNEV